jgi:hypothetical protein
METLRNSRDIEFWKLRKEIKKDLISDNIS